MRSKMSGLFSFNVQGHSFSRFSSRVSMLSCAATGSGFKQRNLVGIASKALNKRMRLDRRVCLNVKGVIVVA